MQEPNGYSISVSQMPESRCLRYELVTGGVVFSCFVPFYINHTSNNDLEKKGFQQHWVAVFFILLVNVNVDITDLHS